MDEYASYRRINKIIEWVTFLLPFVGSGLLMILLAACWQ